jgi:hypothetical protein
LLFARYFGLFVAPLRCVFVPFADCFRLHNQVCV